MEVICLEDQAFYSLLEKVIEHIKREKNSVEDLWISSEETMKKLRITSKTTLQKFRDEGRIKFSQSSKKNILYYSPSINEYLEKHSQKL